MEIIMATISNAPTLRWHRTHDIYTLVLGDYAAIIITNQGRYYGTLRHLRKCVLQIDNCNLDIVKSEINSAIVWSKLRFHD